MKFAALMYHELSNGELKGRFWVSFDEFRRQLDCIAENGFVTPGLQDIGDVVGKKVLVTLDDGHKSNFAAAEEMVKRGQKGVFYILKDKSLGDSEYLKEEQIREIAAMGHEIGIHGKNHKFWTTKSDSLLCDEIAETKNWLEGLVDKKVTTCSAPGGKIDARVVRLITRRFPDLRYIRTSRETYNTDDMKSYLLNCVAIRADTSMREFSKIINVDEFTHFKLLAVYRAKELAKKVLRK